MASILKRSDLFFTFVIWSSQFVQWASCDDNCRNIIYKIPIDDKILVGHVIANLTVNSKDQCEKECYFNPNCISLNYNTNPGETPNCQLSSSDKQTGLQPKPGFIYQAMQNNCAKETCSGMNKTCQSGYGSRGYRCVCRGCFTGVHCHQYKDDAIVGFPKKSIDQTIVAVIPFNKSIEHFTIYFWAQINPETHEHAVFSYSVKKEGGSVRPNEILVEVFTKGINTKNQVEFRIKNIPTYFKTDKVKDGKWHHFAGSWESSSGRVKFYVDGDCLGSKKMDQLMERVIKPGALVLGQDQDSYIGGFQKDQSFQGNLTRVNMWDKVLTEYEIAKLAKNCQSGEGNLIKWKDLVEKNVRLPLLCGICLEVEE